MEPQGMLKRRRTEQDELLTRQDAPPVALPRRPGRLRGAPPSPLPPAAARPTARVALPVAQVTAVDAAPPEDVRAPQHPRKRKRRRGILLVVRPIAVLAAIVIGLYLAAPLLMRADRLRPAVEETLGRTLGRKVRIGDLKFTFGMGGLVAGDVTVSDDPAFAPAPFAHARQAKFAIERLPLIFGGNVRIRGVDLTEPSLTLTRNSSGQWNFTTMLTAGAAAGDAPRVRIRNGIVTIRGAGDGDPTTLRDLNADFPRFSSSAETTFSLSSLVDGGGTLKLNGKAGPVVWSHGAPGLPMSVLVNARKLALNGANVTSTFAPALDGLLTFDGAVESDGSLMTVTGNANIAELKLARLATPTPDPLMLVFTVQHDLETRSGSIGRCEVHLGKGSAEITGKYSGADGRTVLHLKAEAHGVPAAPMGSLLAAAAAPLPSGTSLQGGVAFFDLAVDGPIGSPSVAGSVTLNNTKLVGFDLEERLSSVSGFEALHFSRDLPINDLTAKVSADQGRIAVESIEIDLPELGTMTGAGSIFDDHTLEFQMQAVRSGVSDRHPIPFAVRGACVAPIFRMPGKTR